MKKLSFTFLIIIFTSCTTENLIDEDCYSDDCLVNFWIDNLEESSVYLDSNGYWHLDNESQLLTDYFTIKGEIKNPINGNKVQSIDISFDSDTYIFLHKNADVNDQDPNNFVDVTFKVPNYVPFDFYTHEQMVTPVKVANQKMSICFMHLIERDPLNITGYRISSKENPRAPLFERMYGIHQSNNYTPEQKIIIDRRWKGDTLTIFTRTKYNYELVDSKVIDMNFKVIMD